MPLNPHHTTSGTIHHRRKARYTLRAIIKCLLAHLLWLPLLLGAAGTTGTGGLRRLPTRRRLLLATTGGGLLLRSGLGHGVQSWLLK